MSDERRLAPEVSAARLQAGVGELPIGAVRQTEMTGLELMDLVAQMSSAERVDILGVLPRALGEALLAVEQAEGVGDDMEPPADTAAPRELVYLTPSRERVSAYRHEHVMGRVVQRWSAGLVCFRNWTSRRPDDGAVCDIRLIDDLFLDCIVVCRQPDGSTKVWVLNLLPQAAKPAPRTAIPPEGLVITQVQAGSVDSVLERFEDLRTTGRLLVDRGLICDSGVPGAPVPGDPDLPNEFTPILTDLRPVWRSPRVVGATLPVCVVALCTETARGPGVLLLHRNFFNSRNDFDTLSLLSERVAEEDFAQAMSVAIPEADAGADDVLEYWWLALGQPHPMGVPHAAFIAAGQREVFMSCGLDLAAGRFRYCGSHVLEREDVDQFLGFLAFRVELRRDDSVDELTQARDWNSDLVFVLADELYRPRSRDPGHPRDRRPLNRLLTKRPEWVMSVLVAGEAGE